MTSAMSNAILEYAKLAGQLDCKTNQQLNKIASKTAVTKANNVALSTNRRKREFASTDEIELKKGNFLDKKLGKPVENGFDCKKSDKPSDEQSNGGENDSATKETKGNSEATKGERKASSAKQYRQVDGDIGKLSEQLDSLESDLKPKNDDGDLENGEEPDCKLMVNGDLHSSLENEKLMNGLENDLENSLENNEEYTDKIADLVKDGKKKATDFNNFYSTNRLNDSRTTGKFKSSKRMQIRNRSNEIGRPQQSAGNDGSASSSPNDGSLNGLGSLNESSSLNGHTTTPSITTGSSGNDSYTFEDNLADENRCSSTTSINSSSNNGMLGKIWLDFNLFSLNFSLPLFLSLSLSLSNCFSI